MKKRTNIDFSEHEVIVKDNEHVVIHHLKKPGTIVHSIKYINVEGKLLVTGDFGNWVFCRSFMPEANEYVSDGYWLEKLAISSSQVGKEFSSDKTRERINELIQENTGIDSDYVEYLNECLERIEGTGEEYRAWAYENYPSNRDYESVPYETDIKFWLRVVFDGFDEICERLTKDATLNGAIATAVE